MEAKGRLSILNAVLSSVLIFMIAFLFCRAIIIFSRDDCRPVREPAQDSSVVPVTAGAWYYSWTWDTYYPNDSTIIPDTLIYRYKHDICGRYLYSVDTIRADRSDEGLYDCIDTFTFYVMSDIYNERDSVCHEFGY